MKLFVMRDDLLDYLIKSGKTDLIKSLFNGDTLKISSSELIDLVNPGQDNMVEVSTMVSKRVSSSKSGVVRFNIGQMVRFGENPNIYKVVNGGLENSGTIQKASKVTAIEMAVAENVSLEVIQLRHPKGVAGLSHPKW
ncbi:hypothetical protein, partial [Ignavibacterium sp.]|uniref:hypothetical protein n=1 Tax=Ignavibacterium sp. TaxID=2651167 RepID=UPI00307EDFF7